MTIQTSRHKLPLLAVGQAQKEYTHNEAMIMIDNLINLTVLNIAHDPEIAMQSATDVENQGSKNWLIGKNATGAWRDRSDQIAVKLDSGWRYLEPIESMTIYNAALNNRMIYKELDWHIAPILTNADGGDTIDFQARESINEIIELLRLFG